MPVRPVSWRPEVSEASQILGFELSGPPQCSSRVTSNLGGAPLVNLDDVIWFGGAFTQCSSKGHSRSFVCLLWKWSLFARVRVSGPRIRLPFDIQVVFIRATSIGSQS